MVGLLEEVDLLKQMIMLAEPDGFPDFEEKLEPEDGVEGILRVFGEKLADSKRRCRARKSGRKLLVEKMSPDAKEKVIWVDEEEVAKSNPEALRHFEARRDMLVRPRRTTVPQRTMTWTGKSGEKTYYDSVDTSEDSFFRRESSGSILETPSKKSLDEEPRLTSLDLSAEKQKKGSSKVEKIDNKVSESDALQKVVSEQQEESASTEAQRSPDPPVQLQDSARDDSKQESAPAIEPHNETGLSEIKQEKESARIDSEVAAKKSDVSTERKEEPVEVAAAAVERSRDEDGLSQLAIAAEKLQSAAENSQGAEAFKRSLLFGKESSRIRRRMDRYGINCEEVREKGEEQVGEKMETEEELLDKGTVPRLSLFTGSDIESIVICKKEKKPNQASLAFRVRKEPPTNPAANKQISSAAPCSTMAGNRGLPRSLVHMT